MFKTLQPKTNAKVSCAITLLLHCIYLSSTTLDQGDRRNGDGLIFGQRFGRLDAMYAESSQAF